MHAHHSVFPLDDRRRATALRILERLVCGLLVDGREHLGVVNSSRATSADCAAHPVLEIACGRLTLAALRFALPFEQRIFSLCINMFRLFL